MADNRPFPYVPGQTPEPLVPSWVVVDRYLAQANVARQTFQNDCANNQHRCLSILMWLGSLQVVIDGWYAEGLRDPIMKSIAGRPAAFVKLLRDARDTAFHYEPSLIPYTLDQVYDTAGFISWAEQIHDALVEASRKYAQTSRIPAGLRRLYGQSRKDGR